jgi:hypothetical protein
LVDVKSDMLVPASIEYVRDVGWARAFGFPRLGTVGEDDGAECLDLFSWNEGRSINNDSSRTADLSL